MPEHTRIALTREVSSALGRCELTHLRRTPIDIRRARRQHTLYEQLLAVLGCRIERLAEAPELADSVFVEDTAVVLDELAVITRPGAQSRRAETATVSSALGAVRPLARIEAPGTLDGGDVLRVDETIYVGLSSRSNRAGIDQLAAHVSPLGYRVRPVPVRSCLHLKSAVTQVEAHTLLINPHWVDRQAFATMRFIEVDAAEPFGANALCIGAAVVYPASNPATARRLRAHGLSVHSIEMSELEKAEGAVTCCSLIVSSGTASDRTDCALAALR